MVTGTDRKRHGATIRKISRDCFGEATILLGRETVNESCPIPPGGLVPSRTPRLSGVAGSGGRDDRDPAARLLLERHGHVTRLQLERRRDVVPDPDRERLAERALVPEARQVELQRLRLDAQLVRRVLDRGDVQVRLAGYGADRGQLVARQLDVRDAGVREGLEARLVLRARVAQRDELLRYELGRALRLHGSYCRRVAVLRV